MVVTLSKGRPSVCGLGRHVTAHSRSTDFNIWFTLYHCFGRTIEISIICVAWCLFNSLLQKFTDLSCFDLQFATTCLSDVLIMGIVTLSLWHWTARENSHKLFPSRCLAVDLLVEWFSEFVRLILINTYDDLGIWTDPYECISTTYSKVARSLYYPNSLTDFVNPLSMLILWKRFCSHLW